MFTKIETKILVLIYRACCYSFSNPFVWNKGLIDVTVKPYFRIYNFVVWTVLLLKIGHQICTIPILISVNDINGLVLHVMFMIASLSLFIFKINLIIYKDDTVKLINEITTINTSWGAQFLKRQFIKAPKREIAFVFTVTSTLAAAALVFVVSVLTRNAGYSYYSYLHYYFNWTLTFTIFLVIELILIYDLSVAGMLVIYSMYYCCFAMKFWLERICINWPKSTFPSIDRRLRKCILHYKAIYVVNEDFNAVFGSIVIPYMKLMLSVGIVVCSFAVIRLHAAMDWLSLVLVSLVGWSSILFTVPMAIVMSSMYKMSKHFSRAAFPKVEFLTDKQLRITIGRELKTCSPIRCQIGKMYYMESKAKLTWVQKIVNGIKYTLVKYK